MPEFEKMTWNLFSVGPHKKRGSKQQKRGQKRKFPPPRVKESSGRVPSSNFVRILGHERRTYLHTMFVSCGEPCAYIIHASGFKACLHQWREKAGSASEMNCLVAKSALLPSRRKTGFQYGEAAMTIHISIPITIWPTLQSPFRWMYHF